MNLIELVGQTVNIHRPLGVIKDATILAAGEGWARIESYSSRWNSRTVSWIETSTVTETMEAG